MEDRKIPQSEEVIAYEVPQMEKHNPVKAVQGSGDDRYCTRYYNYYYGYYYYYCYYN